MVDEKILKNEEKAVFALRSLYKSYGYLPFKMSKFEEYDLYASNKDFLVSDRVITFNDTDGKLLALKPDVTLSIIKNAANDKSVKNKVYYNENVYRVSGSTGQFKEIMQTGLECIGNTDVSDTIEVICLAAKSLESVSPDFVLDISHMGILSAILDEASDSDRFKKAVTLKIAEKNAHETEALCSEYGISESSKKAIISLTSMYGEMSSVIERLAPICTKGRAKAALFELRTVCDFLAAESFADKIRIDFSVVNNMNYYDGVVFRGFLSGISEGVLSGGEYGKLLSVMGKESGAVGFALYLDLLSELDGESEEYDVDVLLLYDGTTARETLFAKKNALISEGKSVSAQKSIPDKLRYRELIKI
ncbi:MAG: hypothetical protein E7676_06960 [Ruminococcaceae bacterium]|nr:hypothetical protein [Oscillospiraceae bacterium]